jgi:orotidine-5'-phosphate decarboxylase
MVTNPIIVALDLRSAEDAVRTARRLAPFVGGFKIGLGLLHGPGPATVGSLSRIGPVFADAKLHDIPSQVEAAARRLGEYGARWVTAHASGGAEMMEAARHGLNVAGRGGGILAVTVLTSLDAPTLAATGLGNRPGKLVAKLAKAASHAGVEGIVCSAKELGDVAQVAPDLIRVTPGIRPDGSLGDDQRRTATPEEALERGADLLVIGRPITAADDPAKAAEKLAIRLGVLSR